jgi:hypothetical protein
MLIDFIFENCIGWDMYKELEEVGIEVLKSEFIIFKIK